MQSWKEIEGSTVAGRYTLAGLVYTAGKSAWFRARDEQQKPWGFFLQEASSEGAREDEPLLRNLEAASRVKHANVAGVEKSGRTRIGDRPMIYAVLEPTEENLAEILAQRPLTTDETAEIAASMVAGLAAIHEHGMAHGDIGPNSVLAAGDTVKLRGDCLRKVPAEARADACAQDTGDLGATLFEALTQRKLTSPDDPAIGKLPVPFRSIVSSAVVGRWGLAEIALALKKPSLEELRHPVPKVEPAKPRFAEEAAAKKAQTSPPAPKKPKVEMALHSPATAKKKSGAVRILALLAIVAALGGGLYFYRNRQSSQTGTSSSTTSAGAPSAAASPDATPAPVPPAAPSSVRPAGPSGEHAIWRVVVYAFASESAAAHKVKAIAAAHPELKPEVFTATGHGPWLVTVGGPMDREHAFQLRGEVRNEGLPRDSYAQNYSH